MEFEERFELVWQHISCTSMKDLVGEPDTRE